MINETLDRTLKVPVKATPISLSVFFPTQKKIELYFSCSSVDTSQKFGEDLASLILNLDCVEDIRDEYFNAVCRLHRLPELH